MIRFLKGPILWMLFALLAAPLRGEGLARGLEEALSKLAVVGASIRTFTADFVQKKESALFATTLVSRGRLIVKPPDLLIWRVQEPLESLFFMHGETIGTRDPHTGEVKRWSVGPGMRSSYGWLLLTLTGSLNELTDSFRVDLLQVERPLLVLRLTPRAAEGKGMGLSEVLVGFDPASLYLKQIVLAEKSGDRTEIDLQEIKVNEDISGEIPAWMKGRGER